MTYSEKLQDPRWQRLRLLIFERDGWKCIKCNEGSLSLHIHHKKYINGIEPWEYEHSLLETLCKKCYGKEHNIKEVSEIEFESKYKHLIPTEIDIILETYNIHIQSLTQDLKPGISDELEEDILRNIMYLQKQRKEYLSTAKA